MSLAPFVPTLFPLLGALLLLVVPKRWQGRTLSQMLYLLPLLGALIALSVLALGNVSVGVLTLNSPFPMSIREISLVWDGLALQFAFLLIAGLAVEAGLDVRLSASRAARASLLLSAGACVAGLAAADLLTLCICWGLMDVALIVHELIDIDEAHIAQGLHRVWGRALAALALLVAALLLALVQGRTVWAYVALDGVAQGLVMAAAWLRLVAFPLPGGHVAGPRRGLIALSTGGYLWLRLGAVVPGAFGHPWAVAATLVGLLVLALLALLVQTDEQRLEALHLHGVSLLLLVPMIDPVPGFGVAGLAAMGLGVVLVMRMAQPMRLVTFSIGHWGWLPWLVGIASLAGLPLTLGGAAHWGFLRVAYLAQHGLGFGVASVSFILIAVAGWRVVRNAWREACAREQDPDDEVWRSWMGLAVTALLACYLLWGAVHPAGIERMWRNGYPGIDLPGVRTLITGPAFMLAILLSFSALLPMAGLWVAARFLFGSGHRQRLPLEDTLVGLLELDWLYLGLARGLVTLQAMLRRLVSIIEESFILGWTLFWSIVFVIYTLGL